MLQLYRLCFNLAVTTHLILFFIFAILAKSSPVDMNLQKVDETAVQFCDPLKPIVSTAVLCFSPAKSPKQGFESNPTNCSQPSAPKTVASYSCRNLKGDVYTGFLNCAHSGIWLASLEDGNSSLCNLNATILNLQVPSIAIATDIPVFTTPLPKMELLQSDVSFMTDHEIVALQLHNVFRRNHGVPLVQMTKLFNDMAQNLVDSIVSSESGMIVDKVESDMSKKSTLESNGITNLEMNWYFQVSPSPEVDDNVTMISNAVQTWYSGFLKYDWNNIGKTLNERDAIAFARIIWKETNFIGVGLSSSNNITIVVCLYTPGRNIASTEPLHEFEINVPKFKSG